MTGDRRNAYFWGFVWGKNKKSPILPVTPVNPVTSPVFIGVFDLGRVTLPVTSCHRRKNMIEIKIENGFVSLINNDPNPETDSPRTLEGIIFDCCEDYDPIPLQFLAMQSKKSLVFVEEQILHGQNED